MSSVMYVHTKRFVAELQAFSNHFTQLQRVMEGIRAATSGQKLRNEPLKLSLSIYAGSPMILVPVSSKSLDLLVVNLGQLLVKNRFKMSGDHKTISVETKNTSKIDIHEVLTYPKCEWKFRFTSTIRPYQATCPTHFYFSFPICSIASTAYFEKVIFLCPSTH